MARIIVLGVFMADTTYRATRMPRLGETIRGEGFALGPGGKGSNQAVAAARAGGEVHFISRLGADAFGAMAHALWREAGITAEVTDLRDQPTGAACILVDAESGDNAIIIAPGAALSISPEDVTARAALFQGAGVFVTQLEQPLAAAKAGLELARRNGMKTLLNPAPAAPLSDEILAICDYISPNESEAETLTGISVQTLEDAERASKALLSRGVGTVLLTMGARGVYFRDANGGHVVPALSAGPVVETTGAGDAFNGGFAVALAEGRAPLDAVRFGCATAGISVTRAGAAASMPTRAEIDALLRL